MKVVCLRCGKKVRSDRSAFAVIVVAKKGNIHADLSLVTNLKGGEIALHVNGDRECGKEIASYRRDLIEKLELPSNSDVSILDHY